MAKKSKYPVAQTPLILRCHRLMEAFAKSDDERDFYLDGVEGFIIYVDLDKSEEEHKNLEKELESHSDRYYSIPKLTFYETKKIMEGFVHEKVYDIDTKEKLLDIIQSKEARENFLEFIYDHHSELEKWQQYYQERSRIRIIEWLRHNNFHFVFEEDLDIAKNVMEKLKKTLFQKKVSQDVAVARKLLFTKSKTYYSNEALNPRPKRGRPPKQTTKTEIEPQVSIDIYTMVPKELRPFLFTPEITSATMVTFSSKFEDEEDFFAGKKEREPSSAEDTLSSLNKKLASLRSLSSSWLESIEAGKTEFDFEKDIVTKEALEEPLVHSKKKAPNPPAKRRAVRTTKATKRATRVAPASKKAAPKKKTPSKPPKKTPTKAKAKKAIPSKGKKVHMRPLRTTKAKATKAKTTKKTAPKKVVPKKAALKKTTQVKKK